MSSLSKLESSLNDVFVKKAPFQLPEKAKKVIVKYLPWLNLVLGVLTLWGVYVIWQWAHSVSKVVDTLNQLSNYYGISEPVSRSLSIGIWLALIVLLAEALLYIAAFPAIRARKKSGWYLLFYAMLVNVVYGVVILFTDYGGLGSFIGSLIGSVVGLYFLFQIRSTYLAHQAPAAS